LQEYDTEYDNVGDAVSNTDTSLT